MKKNFDYCVHRVGERWYLGEKIGEVWERKGTTYEREFGYDVIVGDSVERLNHNGFSNKHYAVGLAEKLGYKSR